MKKQIVIIGLGRFGISLATTLSSVGHDVLALDRDEKSIENIASQITKAVQADATKENILKELGIHNFDIAIVAMGSAIESSVLCTILLKKMGVGHVVARASNELHGSILEKIGADLVVYPEQEMGTRVAHEVILREISDYMAITPAYGIARLTAPPHIIGEKLTDLGLGPKGKWEVAVLLIQREKDVIVTPGQRETIKPDDILVVAGNHDKLEKMLAQFKKNKTEE